MGKFATSPNAKTSLFPIEASQLVGTLGGIGELVREALGGATSGNSGAAPRVDANPSVPPSRRP